MKFSEKVAYRLKRVYVGIALGLALWLMYVSYLVIANAIATHTPIASMELTLSPVDSFGTKQK
mgnify:CR=1 FL=1